MFALRFPVVVLTVLALTAALGVRLSVADAADRGADSSIEYRLANSGERQPGSTLRTSSFGELLERLRRNDADARVAAEDGEDLVLRLMLFRVIAESKGLR